MVDVVPSIGNIAFIGTAFVGNDDVGVTIEQHARRTEESQIGGERCVAVQETPLVEFQELRTDRAPPG